MFVVVVLYQNCFLFSWVQCQHK